MAGVTEEKIKRLISAHHELSALLILHGIHSSPEMAATLSDSPSYCLRIKSLLAGIGALLLLVSEEDRFILDAHLIRGMKWESVMAEYQKRWPYDAGADKRTYMYRQQRALNKLAWYVEKCSDQIDFSWMTDPIIDEIIQR